MNDVRDGGRGDELRLAAESVEAIARRVAELLAHAEERSGPRRLLTAAEVSQWWGVERAWVYARADQLGARRLGSGKRPRLRFDPDEVDACLAHLNSPAGQRRRRSPAIAADRPASGISGASRAIVVPQRQVAGRRTNAPGPAPKQRPSVR